MSGPAPTKTHYEDCLEVAWEDVLDAFACLGIDTINADMIHSVNVKGGRITVTRFRFDENGDHVIAGDEAATVTTTIGVVAS